MLFSTKFQVIAANVAIVCAQPKRVPRLTANCSTAMWIAMPVRPTRQNKRKRNDTVSLVSLASTSAAKSSATRVSSLLSPCRRTANTNGSSAIAKLPRAVATMSSRILKPCEESCGASSSKRSRRIMKKPLIGSLKVTPSRRRVSAFDARLACVRFALERPAAEAPSAKRLD